MHRTTKVSAETRPMREKTYVMRLSLPVILENLTTTLMQITNMIMVGGLGASATAAVAVNSAPTWVINSLVMAVSVGSTALIAKSTGAKQQEEAEAVCRQTYMMGLAAGLLLSIASFLLAPMIPVWMHADKTLYSDSTAYMRILAAGFFPYYTGVTIAAALRGASDMATPMKVSSAASIMNIVCGFLLIYPTRDVTFLSASLRVWGAGLGVRGAAVSTALTTGISGIVLVAAALKSKSCVRLTMKKLRPDFALMHRLLLIGTPAAMERLSISLGQVIFIGMVAALGTAQLAAHQLVVTIESLSYMPGYGFAAAASTLVGQSLGAQEPLRARLQGGLSIRLCVITMSLIGVALYAFAPWWMTFFTPDEMVRSIGASLLRICAMEQPATALYLVAAGALRGAGETRSPFVIAFFSMGIRLVLTYVFIHTCNMGVQGAWWAMVTDLWIRGLCTYASFRKGHWVVVI